MPARSELLVLTRPAESLDPETLPPAVLSVPLLALATAAPSAELEAALAQAAQAELQICLSAQAARALAERAADYPARLPAQVRWIAVGAATAAELERRLGIRALSPPEGARDSEGVLALLGPVAGCTVALLTAPAGRDWLLPALQAQGARVVVVHLYQRRPRAPGPDELACLRAATQPLVFSATSVALLQQVAALLPVLGRQPADTALVVASERIAAAARATGFLDIRIAGGAAVAELLAVLQCEPKTPDACQPGAVHDH